MKLGKAAPYEERRLHADDSGGLPGWAVVQLDALLAAGVLQDRELDGLDADELTQLAAEAVRTAHRKFSRAAA